MPICPHCGREIDHLIEDHYYDRYERWAVKLDEEGYLEWYERLQAKLLNRETSGFCCPECGKPITYSWDEARKFLMGDLETQLKLIGEARRGRRDG